MTKTTPEGFATITPTLVVTDGVAALELYKKAFNAKEDYRLISPKTGKVMHACIQIGNSKLFICDTDPAMSPTPTSSKFYLYFDNVDAAWEQAKKAGMQDMMAPEDMFYGDRCGAVKDPFGVQWSLATHIRDVSDADIKKGVEEMCGKAA